MTTFVRPGAGGGDAYPLQTVLHDWDDDEARAILATCRRAIRRNGRRLVLERLIPPPNEDPKAKVFDLFMMTLTGRREPTQAEFAALLAGRASA